MRFNPFVAYCMNLKIPVSISVIMSNTFNAITFVGWLMVHNDNSIWKL